MSGNIFFPEIKFIPLCQIYTSDCNLITCNFSVGERLTQMACAERRKRAGFPNALEACADRARDCWIRLDPLRGVKARQVAVGVDQAAPANGSGARPAAVSKYLKWRRSDGAPSGAACPRAIDRGGVAAVRPGGGGTQGTPDQLPADKRGALGLRDGPAPRNRAFPDIDIAVSSDLFGNALSALRERRHDIIINPYTEAEHAGGFDSEELHSAETAVITGKGTR